MSISYQRTREMTIEELLLENRVIALFGEINHASAARVIMQMFVQVVDVESGQVVQRRDLNFRGDNDESWARAEAFLVRNLAAGE